MTTIRPGTARDARRLAELAGQLGYEATADQALARLSDIVGRDDETVLVAVDGDDRPVGWITVARVRTLTDDATVLIGGLVVDEGRRSSGVGAELLAAGEDWAREHGATEIVVRTRTTRARAHRFYEREGYRLVKESRVYAKDL